MWSVVNRVDIRKSRYFSFESLLEDNGGVVRFRLDSTHWVGRGIAVRLT